MPDLSPSSEPMPDTSAGVVAVAVSGAALDFGAVLAGLATTPPEQVRPDTDAALANDPEDKAADVVDDGLTMPDAATLFAVTLVLPAPPGHLAVVDLENPLNELDRTSISCQMVGRGFGAQPMADASLPVEAVDISDADKCEGHPDEDPLPPPAGERTEVTPHPPPVSGDTHSVHGEARPLPAAPPVRDAALHRLPTDAPSIARDPAIGVEIVARDAAIDRVHVEAPAAVTRELVAAELPRLVTALSANGVGVGSVSVGVGGQGAREGWQRQEPPGARLIWSRAATSLRRTAIRGFTAYA